MHIAVYRIKPGTKFSEHILYFFIIDKRECCKILGMFHGLIYPLP